MKQIETKAHVFSVEYKCTSVYRNPSYWVFFEDEQGNIIKAYTGSDYGCGYGARNFSGMDCKITYHITKAGNYIVNRFNKIEK